MSSRAFHSPPPIRSSRPAQRRPWPGAFWWIGGFGLVLLAVVGPEGISRPLIQLGLPLLLIAGLVYWRVRRWHRRSEKGHSGPYWFTVAKKMWRPRGSGFYALIAAVTFVSLQGEMLLGRGRDAAGVWWNAPYSDGGAFVDFLSGKLWSGVFEVFVGVSLETVLNVVWAGLWPLFWLQRYELITALGAMLLTYAVYRSTRRHFPSFDTVMRRIDAPKEAERSREKTQDESEQKDVPFAQTVVEEARPGGWKVE